MKNVKAFVTLGFFIASLLLVGKVFSWSTLNYNGYCHAEHRYLTETDKIDMAIENVMQSYPPENTFEIVDGKRVIHSEAAGMAVPYGSVQEFKRLNPHCCELSSTVREGQEVTWYSRITGGVSSFVSVDYRVRYRDPAGREFERRSDTFRALSNCSVVHLYR